MIPLYMINIFVILINWGSKSWEVITHNHLPLENIITKSFQTIEKLDHLNWIDIALCVVSVVL